MIPIPVLQLGPKKMMSVEDVGDKWCDLALPQERFDELVRIGGFSGELEWIKFFALACSSLGEVGTQGGVQDGVGTGSAGLRTGLLLPGQGGYTGRGHSVGRVGWGGDC